MTTLIESALRVHIAKKLTTHYAEGRLLSLPFLSERLVTEAEVVWLFVDDHWLASQVAVTSSVALRDGRPSALSKTHVLTPPERSAFLTAFPDAAQPPAERVTITIEREQ